MTPRPGEPLRVMLLFGGRSAEHDVSRVSAVAVAGALRDAGYDVVPVAITKEGRWLLSDDAQAMLDAPPDLSLPLQLPASFAATGEAVVEIVDPTRPGLVPVDRPGAPSIEVDVVFPLLHGPYGEDGTIQGLLEVAGLPYVGSGVVGSAVAMDKVMTKRVLAAVGLAQADYRALREHEASPAALDAIADAIGFPCFVKPANMGSSVGVSKAHDRAELAEAVELAFEYDESIVIEAGLDVREIEVAVLGDERPEASRPGEIIPGADFYSYADKYEDDTARLIAPALLTAEEEAEVRDLAVRAFIACGCQGMARVDTFLRRDGGGFVVNEVNTIPGFTPISMYPKLWSVSGLPYPQLVQRLVELAIARHDRRARRAGHQRH
ncbi:MAG: D-alanine--D-alanine ligase [Actinomycetia bacterium]|nr:D-alanine--D-alanine ligase [Actinomycetes bacterium]